MTRARTDEALPARTTVAARPTSPAPANDPGLLQLQATVGNRAVQAKLELGAVDSPLEAEADQIADQVTGVSGSHGHAPAPADSALLDPATSSAIVGATGGGRPLDGGLRGDMEGALGTDLSGVRVHTDSTADELSRSIHAKAFTTGNDVFFKAGTYNPSSDEGRHLIAHEVVHTTQQSPAVARLRDEDGENPWLEGTKPAVEAGPESEPAGAQNRVPEQDPNFLMVPGAPAKQATAPTAPTPAVAEQSASTGDGRYAGAHNPAFAAPAQTSFGSKMVSAAGTTADAADVGLGVTGLAVGGVAGATAAAAKGISTAGSVATGVAGVGAGISAVVHGVDAAHGYKARKKLAAVGKKNPDMSLRGAASLEFASGKMGSRAKRGAASAGAGATSAGVATAALVTGSAVLGVIGVGLGLVLFGVAAGRAVRTKFRRSGNRKASALNIAQDAHGSGSRAAEAQAFIADLGITDLGQDASELAPVIAARLDREFESRRYAVAMDLLEMLTGQSEKERDESKQILGALGHGEKAQEALGLLVEADQARTAMDKIATSLSGGG